MKKKELISNLIWLVGLLVTIFLVRHFIFTPVTVMGSSMDPTLEDHGRVFALKLGEVERFDIVTFPAPDDASQSYIKRVIGLPGETISYKEDQLLINGEKIDEPYLNEFKSQLESNDYLTTVVNSEDKRVSEFSLEDLFGEERVPDGKLFVLGDNRQASEDSRTVGYIDEEDITGNVKFIFWPISKFGSVNK